MKKENHGYILLSFFALVALFLLIASDPVSQDSAYHNFIDTRLYFGIPNFWNVISNLPFIIVGLIGLYYLNSNTLSKTNYLIFFLGILLISVGSMYYHLNPSDSTLIWDRLPMTISFMALFSIVISEFINDKTGRLMLFPAVLLGLLSVLYWTFSADLRPYLFIQFYPLMAIPIILISFKSKYNMTIGYWWLILAYVIAKIFEHLDSQIYMLFEIISGHTLKHLVSAVGLFILLFTYIKREKRSTILTH